jgi:quercetin dioxygenase-like cupin family protein
MNPISQPANHTYWSDIPVEPMNPLLGRQFVTGTNVMVARITLQKGAHVPLHSHHHEQIASVLSGCLQFLLHEPASGPVDGPGSITGQTSAIREVLLRPNQILTIPPHLPHEVFALEDTINLDIFSPPREDWITGEDAYLRAPQPAP